MKEEHDCATWTDSAFPLLHSGHLTKKKPANVIDGPVIPAPGHSHSSLSWEAGVNKTMPFPLMTTLRL